MSYSIYYNRLAIKTPDNRFMLLLESGDNNVYETGINGREKRSRCWEAMKYLGKHSYTREEIGLHLDAYYQRALRYAQDEKELKRSFGYYASSAVYPLSTRATTWGKFRNFFTKALERAITFEDFVRFCGPMKINYYIKEDKDSIFGDFRNSGSFTDYNELMKAVEELERNDKIEGVWLAPANQWNISRITEILSLDNTPNGDMIYVNFKNGETGYIKSFYPFETTHDKGAAFRIPKKKTLSIAGLPTIGMLSHPVKDVTYIAKR